MLRFVGLGLLFFQYNLSQAQPKAVLLYFPSGTFGLQFRRNFCFNIKFASHIQIPEAKFKITGKFSFLFRALLSCSSVRICPQNKNAMGMRKKAGGKEINQVYQTSHPSHSASVPTVYSGVPIFSDGTESMAFPSNTLTHEATLHARSPPLRWPCFN